jgi:DNA ligase-1
MLMTCSKWFSGPPGGSDSNAKKPEAQQTKLKLQPADPNAQRAAPSTQKDKAVKEEEKEDVEMVDSESANGHVAEPVEEDDEDEELPKSRKRRKITPPVASKPRTKSAKQSKVKKEVEEDDDAEEVASESASNSKTLTIKSKPIAVKEEDSASSAAKEELILDDDEKPEEQAKARKQVLLVLKSSGKDPYPDWKAGEPIPYAALCTTFHKIEMTTKRLEILAHCSLFLRQVLRLTPDDLLETVLLMINKLGADYTGIELGIGESLIMKAIGESTGRSLGVIKTDQNEIGDLGLVAAKSRSTQPTMFKPKALTIKGVFGGLKAIATIEGQGSQGRKVDGIKKLLSSADVANSGQKVDITHEKGGPSEAKYSVRTLEGKLRLGLAEKSVLVALSQAIVYHRAEIVASQAGKSGKGPNEQDLAKGESIMKSVYRYEKHSSYPQTLTTVANFQVTKSSSQPSFPKTLTLTNSKQSAIFSQEFR